jgi:hypothetical protein
MSREQSDEPSSPGAGSNLAWTSARRGCTEHTSNECTFADAARRLQRDDCSRGLFAGAGLRWILTCARSSAHMGRTIAPNGIGNVDQSTPRPVAAQAPITRMSAQPQRSAQSPRATNVAASSSPSAMRAVMATMPADVGPPAFVQELSLTCLVALCCRARASASVQLPKMTQRHCDVLRACAAACELE